MNCNCVSGLLKPKVPSTCPTSPTPAETVWVSRAPANVDRAFTIVELLIVVAIIFILLALLLVTLGPAKERGRRAVCLNNLHQFSLVLHLYAMDATDRLPPGYSDHGEDQLRTWPPGMLQRGIDEHVPVLARTTRSNLVAIAGRNERFLNCPGLGAPFTDRGGYYYQGYGIVLGYNYLGGHGGTPWDMTTTARTTWVSPQKLSEDPKLVLLADLNDWAPMERMTFVPHTASGPRLAQGDSRLRSGIGNWSTEALHPLRYGAAGGNVSLLDGSARWKPIKQMQIYRGSRLYSDDGALAIW